ncbi:uncharacterized protein N0V89_006735 [Didymosphaeria variabile]|uniref:Uncharacterized protein n=1 Tax=Didymosphaeria variabile TaxID=1932322 RepID=A0A9W8XJQ0_9PLEO|nr:uncharacterized protein N0V89_006735 [Didymosphaeria variabile]KAJ4351393.1 hypothetical protein N0V89_006735 [Didymosphaeria variabile]
MPSPFHQKYSSQTHKVFGDNTTPVMPTGPKQDADRRSSDSSMNSNSGSPTSDRRRSSASRFANLEALKRPQDESSVNRRASLQDSYGKVGMFGNLWNKQVLQHNIIMVESRLTHASFTRGPSGPKSPPQQLKEPRDISTLRSE